MPPKKESSKIVNFYEKIPKELLDNAPNPNFHLHQFKVPFRMCIVAPSGSGKTNFLINLINLFSCGSSGTFQTITIITRNKDEPLYRWITTKCDQIVIKEGLTNTPQLDKFDKDYNHLVVWDDLVLSKDLTMVEQYYIRARKLNCSVIFISQSFFRIPKIIRLQCNYLILLKLGSKRDLNLILSDYGLGVDKDELMGIYKDATQIPFDFLKISTDERNDNMRFSKNWSEFYAIGSDSDSDEEK
jgi:hypothetical protein